MPAQKRSRFIRRKNKKKAPHMNKKLKVIGLSVLAIFIFWLGLSLTTRYFGSNTRLSLVIAKDNGEIVVSVFDPMAFKVTNFIIPKNTEVQVARQLGTWKIGSVRKLGENEGLGGKLLRETVVRFFKLPVLAWADSPAQGFASGEFLPLLRAALLPYKTSLGTGDKLKLGLFSFRVKNLKRQNISFSESSFLRKTKLTDGKEGYVLVGRLPNWVKAYFAHPSFSRKEIRVAIVDGTEEPGLAEIVGEVIEVMGAKVVSVEKRVLRSFDCQVLGKDAELTKEIARVFTCQIVKESPAGNFDLEIRLGQIFVKHF
jgi:hypothetical protein